MKRVTILTLITGVCCLVPEIFAVTSLRVEEALPNTSGTPLNTTKLLANWLCSGLATLTIILVINLIGFACFMLPLMHYKFWGSIPRNTLRDGLDILGRSLYPQPIMGLGIGSLSIFIGHLRFFQISDTAFQAGAFIVALAALARLGIVFRMIRVQSKHWSSSFVAILGCVDSWFVFVFLAQYALAGIM